MAKTKKKKKRVVYPNTPETRELHAVIHDMAKAQIEHASFAKIEAIRRRFETLLGDDADSILSSPNASSQSAKIISGKIRSALERQYWPVFYQKTGLPDTSGIDKMDFIDLSNCCDRSQLPDDEDDDVYHFVSPLDADEELEWRRAHYPYDAVPCLEKGRLILNERNSILFSIDKIDGETGAYSVTLALLNTTKIPYLYIHIVRANITPTFHDGDYALKGELVEGFNTYEMAQQAIKSMNWGPDDIRFWKQSYTQFSDEDDLQTATNMLNVFISIIRVVNCILDKERVAKTRSVSIPTGVKRTRHEAAPEETTPARIREIGDLVIKSHRRPRPASRETLVHWRTTTWTVRGHVRHYKSGKTAYIQPGTRSRKALRDAPNQEPGQIGIKVKNENT